VFQTDVDRPPRPDSVTEAEWADFEKRARFDTLFFDYEVSDG
jgi:hypothetical protein